MKAHKYFFSLLLIALSYPLGAETEKVLVDSIVAIVENDIILNSELEQSLKVLLPQLKAQTKQLPPENVLKKQVLERLAVNNLLMQEAERTGIKISDAEIDQSLARLAAQNNITLDEMRETLAKDGVQLSAFRKNLKDELTINRLRQRVISQQVDVTPTEIDLFLSKNIDDNHEYRLSHILVGVPEGSTPERIQKSFDEIQRILTEIQEGMDFKEAAISWSEGQNALNGGDLGWRNAAQVPSLFSDQLDDFEKGYLSEPVRSASGFHLIKISDLRENARLLVNEVHAKHIMIEINDLMEADDAKALIDKIASQLDEGDSFEKLAKKYSDDIATAPLGGDMGWIVPASYGTLYQTTLDGLDTGGISKPIETTAGWHIITLVAKRESDKTDLMRRARANETLKAQKADEAYELWVRQIRDEAFIEYRLES